MGSAPAPPTSTRTRARQLFETQLERFTGEHFPGVPPGLVGHLAGQLRDRQVEPTPAALRPLVERYGPRQEAVR